MSEETDADLEEQMIAYWLHPDHCDQDCRYCREEAEELLKTTHPSRNN